MSDEGLRALERRFRESGAVADEAAWLAARLRAGELSDDRLRLAAWLGHPAAAQVTGAVAGLDAALGDDGWLAGLAAFGAPACVRAGLAAARAVVGDWETGVLHGSVARAPGRVLDAVEAWLAGSRDLAQAREVVLAAADELDDFVQEVGEERLWIPVASGPDREYAREVEPQDEGPRRPKQVAFFASGDFDDHCGLVLDAAGAPTGRIASVHLTWSVEHDPRWPSTGLSSVHGWARDCATYWPAAMPIAAAMAALWVLTPVTLEPFPAFNASAPAAFAALLRSRAKVAAAIRAEVVPWALSGA